MPTVYTIDKTERTGNTLPGIGGVWLVNAHGPDDPSIVAGSDIFSPDGVILDVRSVTKRSDGKTIDIVAAKAARDLSFAVNPRGWLTLTGGDGAQQAVTPPSTVGIGSSLPDFDGLPTWAKVAVAGGAGLLALGIASSVAGDD